MEFILTPLATYPGALFKLKQKKMTCSCFLTKAALRVFTAVRRINEIKITVLLSLISCFLSVSGINCASLGGCCFQLCCSQRSVWVAGYVFLIHVKPGHPCRPLPSNPAAGVVPCPAEWYRLCKPHVLNPEFPVLVLLSSADIPVHSGWPESVPVSQSEALKASLFLLLFPSCCIMMFAQRQKRWKKCLLGHGSSSYSDSFQCSLIFPVEVEILWGLHPLGFWGIFCHYTH